MMAPVDLPVSRLFRSLSFSVPWRGGSNGPGTDTATIATGAGAKSDSDNFPAPPLSFELQTWPIPQSSSPSPSPSPPSSTTPTPRTITTLVEDAKESSPYHQQHQLTNLRMRSAARQREKSPQFPQIRPRTSRGSFDSSRSRSSTISSTSSTLGGDGLTSRKQPQERQRACEDCWKEFWG
ncbi:hypothetical protein PGQ11_002067 [Apiospora arundinis]|uniref:Uncharacterized protein n=1 Tax=Apiospora arundinis TaxID=335852 RepID=A0ABR2JHV8_9PEZI